MSSFFSAHNVNDIPDNPNELPNNTYKFRITSAKFGPTSGGDKHGITFKYQIMEGAYASFFPLTDWVRIPMGDVTGDVAERLLSYLKMRLLAFGFSPEEIQDFGPGDVEKTINREFWGTTSVRKDAKTNNPNIRVNTFALIEDENDADVDFPDI